MVPASLVRVVLFGWRFTSGNCVKVTLEDYVCVHCCRLTSSV